MAKFNLEIYPSSDYDIWFAGLPYTQQPKKPQSLAQWAKQEGADIIYPLAMYNMQKGEVYGRTIQFLRAGGDLGYGGSEYVLGLHPHEVMHGANKGGTHKYAVAGYKAAIVNGTIMPGLSKIGRRSRNCNGLSAKKEYCHMVTQLATEYECAEYAHSQGVIFLLMQDGGGTTAKWQDGKVVFAPEGGRITTNVVCIKRKKAENPKEEVNGMKVKCNVKTAVYDANGKVEAKRYIDKGDVCTVGAFDAAKMQVAITYPIAGAVRAAFIKELGNFQRV